MLRKTDVAMVHYCPRLAWSWVTSSTLVNRPGAHRHLADTPFERVSSQSALGAYFRRMCASMDNPKAVTAAAHKLARLIYTMLTKGEEYTDQGQDYYEERYRERLLRQLSLRAEKMGLKLVASEYAAQKASLQINYLMCS